MLRVLKVVFRSWLGYETITAIIKCILLLFIILIYTKYILALRYQSVVIYPNASIKSSSKINLHRATLYNILSNIGHSYDFKFKTETPDNEDFKVVCYYNVPATSSSLQVEGIDTSLCTHINMAFGEVLNSTIFLSELQISTLKKLVALKSVNKNLRILVSVGGVGNAVGYSEMVLNHANRKRFIKSVINYVKQYHIDGIDLDWEFPNEIHGKDKLQKMHFTQLLEEIRKSINHHPNYPFILTVAVAAPDFLAENCYDISYMNEFVDFVNVMSYDYHFYTKSTPFTGINSPLYPSYTEKYYLADLNINHTANFWNFMGMDKQKINIGLPTYGHSFRLINPNNHGLYAPASNFGQLGGSGFVDYSQVCKFIDMNQILPVFDNFSRSPYAFKYDEWVSYDNVQSLTYKAQYIKEHNFGGAMVYSLNSDDWEGVCEGIRFPLINSIREVLRKDKF